MKKHKLEPLSDYERNFATENHNLVYSFLNRYGYSLEDYYDVAIFGFLKAVQIYSRRKDLRNKYDFPFIGWQYMRSEIGNYLRTQSAKKRKPAEAVISLDDCYEEVESLHNGISGNVPESEVLEMELLTELFSSLSDKQRKIAEMKMDGYGGKEIYAELGLRQSAYYAEMKSIREALGKVIG